jgi:hypothetical protein
MPSDKLIWQGGAGGAVFALMGLWLWSYRADELAACRANPIMIADTCHVPALGAVVVGILLTVGAIGICVAVAMAWQKANQAAKV